MDEDAYWDAVRDMRLGIAELLESLLPAEWEAPSLCRGWRVRDVVGHVASVPTVTGWDMVSAAPRSRFNPNRINTSIAVHHGSRPPSDLLAHLREHASDRRTAKVLDTRNSLFDIIVHSQDIAIPLGREFEVSTELTRAGLQRVWDMGWPFRARRRFAALSLKATDTDWAVGGGPEVVGPGLPLLLLLTGRTAAAVPLLNGSGVSALRA
jgi:uncharacterized protein (TIGR03083 family)